MWQAWQNLQHDAWTAFNQHPNRLGQTWWQHCSQHLGWGCAGMVSSLGLVVHGCCPFWFQELPVSSLWLLGQHVQEKHRPSGDKTDRPSENKADNKTDNADKTD